MRYSSTPIAALVLTLALTADRFPAPCFAAEVSQRLVTDLAGKLVERGVADGLSVGVIQGDRSATYHFGSATGDGTPPGDLTVYEIGSASKVFTGLLTAEAAVRGEIDLAAPAQVANEAMLVLPAGDNRPISWLDLCTHRSGLPRLPTNLGAVSLRNPYRNYDAAKAAEFLSRYELPRLPGKRHEYSNLAVSVLGYLIASRAETDYQTLLRQRIARPLRMVDCTIELDASQRARLATPHRPAGRETPLWEFANLPGAGGIRATLSDMMRFANAQLEPPQGSLGDAIELAWKEHHPADSSGPATGLGWMILPDGTRWHNGETGGSHSILLINRQHRTAVVVLSNTAPGAEVDQLGIQLIRHAMSTKVDAPAKPPADRVDRKRLEGRYQLAPNFVFDVRLVDGRMMVAITNQPTQEVFADSDTKWSYRSVDATLEFHLTDRGPAHALTLHQNGISQRAKRIRE